MQSNPTDTERQIRNQIAAEIADKFGSLAPYKLVQDFIRNGPPPKSNDRQSKDAA